MKQCLILLTIILINSAFSGMIKGFVVNIDDQPMPEANITVIGTTLGSATDEKGYFFIKNIDPGKYILRCTFLGHRDDIERNVKVEDGKPVTVNFLMIPNEMQLEGIEVEQKKEDINNLIYYRELGHSEFIRQMKVPEPDNKNIHGKLKTGFWEMMKYYMWKIFN